LRLIAPENRSLTGQLKYFFAYHSPVIGVEYHARETPTSLIVRLIQDEWHWC
jgi:hypothetical protein